MNYLTLPLNVLPDVSTSSPLSDQPTIGLIGMGAMGKMYAKRLSDAGWRKVSKIVLETLSDGL